MASPSSSVAEATAADILIEKFALHGLNPKVRYRQQPRRCDLEERKSLTLHFGGSYIFGNVRRLSLITRFDELIHLFDGWLNITFALDLQSCALSIRWLTEHHICFGSSKPRIHIRAGPSKVSIVYPMAG